MDESDDNKKQNQYDLIMAITEAAEQLGWAFAIPQEDDDETLIQGLILGTTDFISDMVLKSGMEVEFIESEEGTLTTTKKTTH